MLSILRLRNLLLKQFAARIKKSANFMSFQLEVLKKQKKYEKEVRNGPFYEQLICSRIEIGASESYKIRHKND